MNILFVHEAEYIEKVVYEYQIIPELLASAGHKVVVIDYPDRWKKNSFFDLGNFKTSTIKNVRRANKEKGITLIRPGIIKIPVLSRIIAFFEYYFIIGEVIKKYKIEKIVLYSAPTNGLQTIYWAKKLKIPVLFRLLDVLHQLVPYKILSTPTYYIEKMVYKRSQSLLAITPRLTKYAIKMGANDKTTSYLPSAADTDIFFPKSKDAALLKKYGIKKSDKVILFAGTLYNFSGLDKILLYFSKNIKKFTNLKILIVGGGAQFNLLQDMVKSNNLQNHVILTGFINYNDLPKYINLADICINPFEINEITNIIFPGKIYQYFACAKPVIATKLKGVLDIFPDDKGKNNIYYFDLNNPKEFFQLVKTIQTKKIKDINPSIKEITNIIQDKLAEL